MSRKFVQITQSIVTVILLLALPLLLIPTFVVFGLFRFLLRGLLKLTYRDHFYGLLGGSDVIWTNESLSKSIINFIVIVDFQDDFNGFIEAVVKILRDKCFQRQTKLTCVRQKILGYTFLLKNCYIVEDCIQIVHVNSVFDKTYLQHFIASNFDRNLPKNNTALWEVLIFDKQIKWSENKDHNQFVMLFRIHHSLGDGFALFDMFSSYFATDGERRKSFHLWKTPASLTSWYSCIWSLFIGVAFVTSQLALRSVDRNKLHGKPLLGRKLIVWANEEEEKLIPLVKMIKNKSLGSRFSDVVLAATSASFEDYYLQKEVCVPEYITCAVPALFSLDENCDTFTPRNSFSLAMLNLPIRSFGRIAENLEDVKNETNRLRTMPDYQVYYWLLNLVAPLLPEALLKPMIYSRHSTLSISILPGTDKIRVFNNQNLKDVVFWIPHQGTTGVGLSILTYDNRFQIGLSVDKALISDEKEAQMIVEGIFRHIRRLHQSIFGTTDV